MTSKQEATWSRRVRLPFWNRRENRVRALWRILGAVVIVLLATVLFNVVVVQSLETPFAVMNLVSNGFAVLVAFSVLVVWARYIDRREIRAYGFRLDRVWWLMLVSGAGIAVLGWGGALVTDLLLGWASIDGYFSPGRGDLPFLLSFLLFAVSWVFVGVWEEIVFRGIVMRNAIEGLNFESIPYRAALVGGWIVSSVVFGVLHLDQATSILALIFWILAGLVLGLAYLLTDQLALPIGLHFAFDFSANNVFGLASVREAGTEAPTIIRPEFTGPDLYVGLSGIVNTVWLAIIGALTIAAIAWEYGSVRPQIEPYAH